MKKKILTAIAILIVVLIVGFITLIKINFLDYEKPISYQRINEITFKNFRGLEFFQNSLHGNKSFAYVYTSIDYSFEDDSVSVESFFHPSRSYVYNQKAYSKDLLTHEMYHFRITELYARIAKKRISETKAPTKNTIDSMIAAVINEEREFQIKYDDDTFHSYVLGQQRKYEKDIDSLLALHDSFRKPKVNINEK